MHKLIALSLTGLLAACASAPSGPVLAPNANLLAQGIPPIPMSLVERVAKYTDFRGHSFVEWHPTNNEMLVAHRKAGATPESAEQDVCAIEAVVLRQVNRVTPARCPG